ncbi:MAG: Cd(II)/Pb(II)-responsive transcriptional regulator [Proteobacteria bacterium]|nr:Cd(II)/Pb(II)-responsive transcriptional regulator [Pseudomonadota bacterium]
MKIGELSKRSLCSIQTIRYYEKEGLLAQAQRSEGNFRLYDDKALQHLLFIKHCRNLDISLSEIKELIQLKVNPSLQCKNINQIFDNHIEQVNLKILELNQLKIQLQDLRQNCTDKQTIENCGILHKLSY